MFRISILAAGLLGAVAASRSDEPSDKALGESAARLNQLGIQLLATMPAKHGNIAVSPWSVHRVLVLTALGAQGETLAEITKALGTDQFQTDATRLRTSVDKSVQLWNGLVQSVTRESGGRADRVEWADVCAAWADSTVNLRAEYAAALRNLSGTQARSVDFRGNAGKVTVDINEWIASSTRGQIPRLIPGDALNQETRLALTAATYIKAPWTTQFKAKQTTREPFAVGGGKAVPIPTMVAKAAFCSAVMDDCTAIGIPATHDFQLLILVPKAVGGLDALRARLTPELLQSCANMKSSLIELHLPRFRVPAATRDLREPLGKIGIRTAFDDTGKADFSLMASTPLFVQHAFHGCEFRIDEHGLSGAGVTALAPSIFRGDPEALPADSVFRVDRPFVFALQHRTSGVCLFIGCISGPE